MARSVLVVAAVAAVTLAGCERNPLEVRRSVCPAVAVPAYAGDITLFRPGTPPDAGNIDVVATITNVREACNDQAARLTSDVSFDVVARRSDSAGARDVALPVFATVVQGGNLIVSKQIGNVTVRFADGAARTVVRGGMRANVLRSAAALPPDLLKKVGRKRRAQDLDASVDPMSDPQIRAAMRAASFEVLVGFQLDETRLAYNVAK